MKPNCMLLNRHSQKWFFTQTKYRQLINSPPTLYMFAAIASRFLGRKTLICTHFQFTITLASLFTALISRN